MKKKGKEEPCCFYCRSFSPYKGKKAIGYCMKLSKGMNPKDVCAMFRP